MSVHPVPVKDAMLRKGRLPRLTPSSASSSNGNASSGSSILPWRRKKFGDKLQYLADHEPSHLQSLERLVDQLIRYVKAKPGNS